MSDGVLKIAGCQFAVGSSISENAAHIQQQMRQAKEFGADIAQFPECALSGYAGVDMQNLDNLDWDTLTAKTKDIMALAAELDIWVVLGSSHRLTEPNRPTNCLYLINSSGEIADRYDKRFCTESDLQHYTPGGRFVVFEINGVKCALLICFDLRFPELYRELVKLDVNFVIQSFYNARQKGPSVHTQIMRQTMQCRAATNGMWVSMVNSSGYYSPYPSCFITPDGVIGDELKQNEAGVMVNTVDLSKDFYDPSEPFRKMAMAGELNNGPEQIDDERMENTRLL